MTDTPYILKKILDKKAEEVASRKLLRSISDLEEIAQSVEKPRGFAKALQAKVAAKRPLLLNEKSIA